MCIGGSPKMPAPQPLPSPSPVPTPSESSPQASDDARRRKLEQMRAGLASTIKTSARGIVGSGAELSKTGATGKVKLGA